MATLTQVAGRMLKRAAGVQTQAAKLVQDVTLLVAESVINDTPVDKGTARSNWRVVSGHSPPGGVLQPYAPGSKLGKGERANAQAALQAARAVVRGRPGGEYTIFNNVKYMWLLNAGSSTQAPEHFVQKAVVKGALKVRSSKILVEVS